MVESLLMPPMQSQESLLPNEEKTEEINFPRNQLFICINVLSGRKETKKSISEMVWGGKAGENDCSEQRESSQKTRHSYRCHYPALQMDWFCPSFTAQCTPSSSEMPPRVTQALGPPLQIFVVLTVGNRGPYDFPCHVTHPGTWSFILEYSFSLPGVQSGVTVRLVWYRYMCVCVYIIHIWAYIKCMYCIIYVKYIFCIIHSTILYIF